MKRLLLLTLAGLCCACATQTPPPTKVGIVFITFTPSATANASPTEEALPFRDLSTETPTASSIPPSPTLPPASPTHAPVAVAPLPTVRPNLPTALPTAQALVLVQAQVTEPPTDPPPAPPTQAPPQPISDAAGAEQTVIDLTNTYRTQNGLSPLARDEGVMGVARSRSADMVARGYFDHYDPVTGQSLARPLLQALGFQRTGENIYWSGHSLAEVANQAVNWFMGDAPHRANILNTAYTSLGVGIAWNGQGWVLTQDFAGP